MREDATKTFDLVCNECGEVIPSMDAWFLSGQKCPVCGSHWASPRYDKDYRALVRSFAERDPRRPGIWRYFPFLPLGSEENIVSLFESDVTLHRWAFLERYARERYGLNLIAYAHRQDRNYATATFKDLAGSVVASALKEQGVREYVVASTGNIGVAFSRYLKEADITLYAFIPNNSPLAQEAEIGCFGQKVFRVDGDYTTAKQLAADFAAKHDIPNAAGSFDPLRVEAKKTMLYEWLRLADHFPTVYIQALSGGTGPLGISRASDELQGIFFDQRPRLMLVQSDRCSPMADAWERAKAAGFPEGWEKDFPVLDAPETRISTLATGNPTSYPQLAPLVKKSGGEITRFPEGETTHIAMLAAAEEGARIGPAAAIGVGGFFKALQEGYLRDGDVVAINVGEGIRRQPQFLETFVTDPTSISSLDEAKRFDPDEYTRHLYDRLPDRF